MHCSYTKILLVILECIAKGKFSYSLILKFLYVLIELVNIATTMLCKSTFFKILTLFLYTSLWDEVDCHTGIYVFEYSGRKLGIKIIVNSNMLCMIISQR